MIVVIALMPLFNELLGLTYFLTFFLFASQQLLGALGSEAPELFFRGVDVDAAADGLDEQTRLRLQGNGVG